MKRAIKTATIFDGRVDVYLLEDGGILLSSRGAVRALGVAETTPLGRLVSRIPSGYAPVTASATYRFIMPQGGTADGITPVALLAIMRAYSEAFDEGKLHESQQAVARNCNRLLRALTEVGLVKVCEEALGIIRGDAEALLRTALLRDEPARDSIWPVRFVEQYAKWNGLDWRPGQKPPFSMKNANGFFYDMIFTPEIRALVKDKSLEWVCRQHQVLAQYPRDYVVRNLKVAEGLSLFSISETAWRKKMREFFGKIENPDQLRLGFAHAIGAEVT